MVPPLDLSIVRLYNTGDTFARDLFAIVDNIKQERRTMPRDPVSGLGKRIQERRMEKDIKQATLARQAGIAPSYLSELETTEGMCPSAIVLYRIAVALDTNVPYLLGMPDRSAAPINRQAVPPTLQRARAVYRMADDEVALLSGLEYRGRRPRTEEDWFFLLCAIKRTVGGA